MKIKFFKKLQVRKGFTLTELVVVILVIVILAIAVFLGGATIIKQARVSRTINDLRAYGVYTEDMFYCNPNYVKTGISDISSAANKYLTPELKFSGTETTSVGCAKTDIWNNPYTITFDNIDSQSSAAILIWSNGPNSISESSLSGITPTVGGDDIAILVTCIDGAVVKTNIQNENSNSVTPTNDEMKLLITETGLEWDVPDEYVQFLLLKNDNSFNNIDLITSTNYLFCTYEDLEIYPGDFMFKYLVVVAEDVDGNEIAKPTVTQTAEGLTWDEVDGVDTYRIYTTFTPVDNLSNKNFNLKDYFYKAGYYKFIVACSNGVIGNEIKETNEVTVRALDAPIVLYDDNIMSWSFIDGATSYKIYADDTLYDEVPVINGKFLYEYDLTQFNIDYPDASIRVKSYADKCFCVADDSR